MDDSIINIDDECELFSLSSDTDIQNIVDQWKRNHETTEFKDLKHVDTRTFTRPKKKLFPCTDVNSTFSNKSSSDELSSDQVATASSSGMPVPKIDLKIGGLVTSSMQRSLLGDVSPPLHMDNSMGNSLITSNDFSNIDFMNETGDSLAIANFKQYRLSDAIADRNFLERLTNYDESLFTKDADINNVDLIENGNCTGSSTSTLQNSTDSTSNLVTKNDGTFSAPTTNANGTFDASCEVDKTFIRAPSANVSIKNSTFELAIKPNNQTFETQSNKLSITIPVVSDLDDEELALCDSLNATKILNPDMNSTFQLDEYQSTPAAGKIRKNRQSDSLTMLSPILSEKKKNLTPNVDKFDKFVDIEIEDVPVYLRESVTKNAARASNPTGINTELIEKERESLAKFEEFENTMLILENNKTEEEFDDLLNSFGSNIRNPLSQKVRQSLDNIKKRHSLIGMEKQHHDELNREKTLNTSKNGKYSEFGSSEKNRLNDTTIRSPMITSTSSSSGSGERLLRRSRLFDDVINTSTDKITDNGAMEHSSSSIGYNDNKQANELNSTQTLNKKNQQHLEKDYSPKTDTTATNPIYNTDDSSAENKANNRDRFKTIRIFKRPPENAIQIPDPGEAYEEMQSPVRTVRSMDVFATKNTNSPKQRQTEEAISATAKAINTMTFKKSGLARPRQLSGLVKRDFYSSSKSSSHELLLSDEHLAKTHSKPVQQIKSPMGIKSKSIHNLSTAKYTSKLTTNRSDAADIEQSSSTRNSNLSSHTFKVPAPKASITMRSRPDAVGQPRKLGLVRPSSGYYGYNTKRTDSDSDLGRFSSNNSLSSGSSKSSLSRGETPESFAAANESTNITFVQPSLAKTSNVPSRLSTANGNTGLVQPKLSLLRQPNQIRRSALPRPAAYSTKR
ncbi:dentin sialophosphoprotein [Contarinia nasturtii]|uniref:dentin sialophosphoprotein n=1 Tax=Contarinia nasturtii TaxID=265458 RepID=UPI0012D419D8|nr:dentin sialophosphoprotein [Contarinia nasturtii]